MTRILSTTSSSFDKKRSVQGQLSFNFIYPTQGMTWDIRGYEEGLKYSYYSAGASFFFTFRKTFVIFIDP